MLVDIASLGCCVSRPARSPLICSQGGVDRPRHKMGSCSRVQGWTSPPNRLSVATEGLDCCGTHPRGQHCLFASPGSAPGSSETMDSRCSQDRLTGQSLYPEYCARADGPGGPIFGLQPALTSGVHQHAHLHRFFCRAGVTCEH